MTDNTENTKKDYTFVLLYAISIIAVTDYHVMDGLSFLYYGLFPLFTFLFIFMFSSGYFYTPDYELNIKNFIIKKTKKLIVPLYLWNVFYAIILFIIQHFGFFTEKIINLETFFIYPITDGHQFLLNLGGWYIIPLYMIHITNVIIRKIFRHFNIPINEILFFLITLILGCLGVLLANQGYNDGLFLVLTRFLTFFPCYSLGILYRKYKTTDNIKSLPYFLTIIILLLIVFLFYNKMYFVEFSWSKFYTDIPILPFIAGFLAIGFWLRISKIFAPLLGTNKYINIIAGNTYSIMINQFAGFMLLKSVFAFLHQHTCFCSNFDMTAFKTDIFYYYLPMDLRQFSILYVIAGILIAIFMQKTATLLKNKIQNLSAKN